MAGTDILSQEEIDALLSGVDNGQIKTEPDEVGLNGEVQLYDFASQDRIGRGRMPALEMVNERFGRRLRVSLFNLLRRSPEVSVDSVQTIKFAEYVTSLFVPANVHLVKFRPLRGTSLFTFDPKLIFVLVDHFFGGSGRFQPKIEGRDCTPTEMRVVERVLELVFSDLGNAWSPVFKLDFEHVGSDVNLQFTNVVSPGEVMVVTVFHIELEGSGGEFHIAMPYSMIEPIHERLDTGVQSDASERDVRWVNALKGELETSEVEISTVLASTDISLGELIDLAPGDVVSIDFPETVVAQVEDVPVFMGKFGISRGNLALKVVETLNTTPDTSPLFEQESSNE